MANDPEIEKFAVALHDTFRVEFVAPGHCTSEPAFAAFQKVFGDHYLYGELGARLALSTFQK